MSRACQQVRSVKLHKADCYYRTILKNGMNSSFYSNHPGAIHPTLQIDLVNNSQRGKEFIKFCPQAAATTFAFASVFILLLLWCILYDVSIHFLFLSVPPTHRTASFLEQKFNFKYIEQVYQRKCNVIYILLKKSFEIATF